MFDMAQRTQTATRGAALPAPPPTKGGARAAGERRPRVADCTIAAGLLAFALAVAGCGGGRSRSPSARHLAVVRVSAPARRSPCDHPPRSRLTYPWPVKPFARQHPVRGNFGDPRTLTSEAFGADTPRSPGLFSFHNGIDIAAPVGTRVYPVVSGVVVERKADEIVVRTDDGRTFQYWHLLPLIRAGQRVVAERTVLGTIRPEARHVHLTEIDGFRVHNPADPGHIEPYRDHTVPRVSEVTFREASGSVLDPRRLRGRILIDARAQDEPPEPVPGAWLGFPVTPALVAWRLTDRSGHPVVPERTVADFRRLEPPTRDFWRVYGAGTYQNNPVFAHHYFWHVPGRYVFNLTPAPLDTTRLPNGRYVLTVDAADVCGNRGSLSERIDILNKQEGAPPHGAARPRGSAPVVAPVRGMADRPFPY